MYQQITIVGNLGSDPLLKFLPDGTAVTSFPVATNKKWTDSNGNKQEQVTWFRVSVWQAQAEACNQYLSKGHQVMVVGQLTPDKQTGGPRLWTDNDGNVRSSFEVRAFTVRFLGGNQQGQGQGQSQTSSNEAASISDDDIPF